MILIYNIRIIKSRNIFKKIYRADLAEANPSLIGEQVIRLDFKFRAQKIFCASNIRKTLVRIVRTYLAYSHRLTIPLHSSYNFLQSYNPREPYNSYNARSRVLQRAL